MNNARRLPRRYPERVVNSQPNQDSQPAQETITIDLTGDDYETPAKVVVSNDRHVLAQPLIDNLPAGTSSPQPSIDKLPAGTSRAQPTFDKPPAGTSRQLLGEKKHDDCVNCGAALNHLGWVVLDCQHRMCRLCFAFTVGPESLTPGVCSVPNCRAAIANDVIARCLRETDTWRDPLLRAFEIRTNGNNDQTPADSTMSPEPTARVAPKRRLSMQLKIWQDESQNIDKQPYWSNVEKVRKPISHQTSKVKTF